MSLTPSPPLALSLVFILAAPGALRAQADLRLDDRYRTGIRPVSEQE